MSWIIWMVIFVVLAIAAKYSAARASRQAIANQSDSDFGYGFRVAMNIAFSVIVGLMAITTGRATFHQVPYGNVGILTQFGGIEGQVGEGLQIIPPWKEIMLANVQIQGLGFKGETHLESFSIESQDVFVEATINFRVSPEAIQNLYRNFGPNYVNVLVVPRVKQNFKDETVKYESVQIAPNREKIRRAVRDRLENELSVNSIEVTDLLLDNVDFSPAFKAAIEGKQVATQDALREFERVQQRRNEAEQAFYVANGQARAVEELARGQASANRQLTESLTPEVIQWQAVQKLADKIQIALLPSGQGIIIDPASLLGTNQARPAQ